MKVEDMQVIEKKNILNIAETLKTLMKIIMECDIYEKSEEDYDSILKGAI